MKLPKKIRVLGREWSVETTKNNFEQDGELSSGACIREGKILKIALEEKNKIKNTFLHESIHALIAESGVDLSEKIDEVLTHQLEYFLLENWHMRPKF